MSWQVQETIYIGNSGLFWPIGDFYNVVTCANLSFLQHAEVKAGSVMFYEQRCHLRFIHANADAVARHARLCDFKYCIANAISIADADLVIRKSLDGEVFPELAESKIVAAQNALPVMVRVHLVGEYSAVLPAVTGEISLPIANNVELAHHPPSINWGFPDRGMHSLTVPCHVARKTDIY